MSTRYGCGSIMVGFYSIRHITNKGRTPIRGQTVCICLYGYHIMFIFSNFFSSLSENLPFIPFPLRAPPRGGGGEGGRDERVTRAWDAWLV